MNTGDFALLLAAATGVAAIATSWRFPRASTALLRAHAGAGVAALGVLLTLFLVSDVATEYVWAHTHASYGIAYRIAGVWGGEAGTIVLWGALVAALALAVRRTPSLAERTRNLASLLLAGLATALLSLAHAEGVFAPTGAAQLARAPLGRGLADVLVTPLMVIHPPIQFIAYALIAVPAAIALAGLALRDDHWAPAALSWARPAWLASTVGLGLGALWAYYVLSFGGYWAWDPVENANLLPWLALTIFLHAGKLHAQARDAPLSAPLAAVAALALTLFGTFATRSGLWVSVHAFTDPTERFEPDAAARLLAIVDVHLPSRVFLALATVVALVGIAVLAARSADHLPRWPARYLRWHSGALFLLAGAAALDPSFAYATLFETARATRVPLHLAVAAIGTVLLAAPAAVHYLHAEGRTRGGFDVRRLMRAGVALLVLAAVVVFLLNLQIINGQDRRVFDARAPLLTLPVIAVLTVAMALRPFGRRAAFALAGAGLAAGAGAWLLFPDARVVALTTPPLAAALVATLAQTGHSQGRHAPRQLRAAAWLLMISSLLGIAMWSNPPAEWLGFRLPRGNALPFGLAGIVLGAAGLIGSIAAFRARGFPLAMVGAVSAALAAGFVVGAPLGVAALALVARQRAAFAPAAAFLRHEAPRVREAGIYVVHVALVLALVGYAASTYSQARADVAAGAPGDEVALGSWTAVLGEARGDPEPDGTVRSLVVPVQLWRDGAPQREAEAVLLWRDAPRSGYEGRLEVRRTLFEDVYLDVQAVRTTPDGWTATTGPAAPLTTARMEAATFTLIVLPMMTLVWAGLWLMGIGMLLVLAGAWGGAHRESKLQTQTARPDAHGSRRPPHE